MPHTTSDQSLSSWLTLRESGSSSREKYHCTSRREDKQLSTKANPGYHMTR